MAEIERYLQQSHQSNESLQPLFAALDPMSLLLSQNTNSQTPNLLKLTTECFIMERGPRYKAYAELRESKLRRRNMKQEPQEHESNLTPRKKQVKFQGGLPGRGRRGSSALAQSVPDFSSAKRKENRKPVMPLPPTFETTPPPKKCSPIAAAKFGGSKSAIAGEKRGGGLMARKSCASVAELKGFSTAAARAINGENKGGGRTGRCAGKTVLGYRQF